MQKVTPCLWFNDQAEEAVAFYTAIFNNSKTLTVARYGEAGQEIHGRPAGSVMTVAFELAGQAFTALNGGPAFTFNEAISFQVNCETQEEVDYYWQKLSAGGDEKAQ
jgi:predicted 3-demethylubiquinone-9 3-methyltransferase (glyoxalase superfamily)